MKHPSDVALAQGGARGVLALFLGRPRTREYHYDALDGLRGLAVLVVIASHLSNGGWLPIVPLGGTGKSGVYLFFVLSAFLLTRLLLDRTPAQFADARMWGAYVVRRILRIWPLYLLVLFLSWALTEAGVEAWHFQLGDAELVRHLALREGQGVLWSIPVEFKFYGWLPFVALGLAWMVHRHWSPTTQLLVAVAAVAACVVAWPPGATGSNDVRLGPYLVLFLCGAFAATLDRQMGDRARNPRAWGVAAAVALAAIALTLPVAWAAVTGTPLDRKVNHNWFLFFGIAWSVLLLAVLHGPAWLRAGFESPAMRLVGVVSFSAYLWHRPVMDALEAIGAREWPAAVAWVLAAILVVSMVSFLLVERPWRDLRLLKSSVAPRRSPT